jgi:hypothetical protein
VICSSQDHLKTGTHDLDHPVLAGVENTDSWHARKGELQRAFPLDVLMIPSPKLSFVANINNPTGASLAPGSTIHFGSLEFTVDRLSRLSLSPQEGDSSAIFIGMVHSGTPSLHTTLEETSDEDGATSGARGSSGSPDPRRCNVVTPTDPITTTPLPPSQEWSPNLYNSKLTRRNSKHEPTLGRSTLNDGRLNTTMSLLTSK